MTRGRVIAGTLAAIFLTAGAWFVTSNRENSDGPRYVLWKSGVLPFDASVVYPAMVGDRQRERLVVGLSVQELERKFGRLRTRSESTPEYQKYYSERFFLDKQILWLGESQWLVVLRDGRVEALHLMKG
jgi:hypothetical protein